MSQNADDDFNAMTVGQRVEVLLHGDDDWYPGTVLRPRKMEVQLDDGCYSFDGFIANENSIREWRPIQGVSAS